MTLQQRIQAGIALLDEHYPDWRSHLLLDALDMDSNQDGLLEQIFKMPYIKAIRALGVRINDGYDYGFDIKSEGSDEENKRQWRKLTDAWKQAIAFVPLSRK